jgi:RND family efflux transporter MFP subunit
MNKPELFSRAKGLFKRVADVSERALGKPSGDATDDAKRRRRILLLGGAGLIAAIAVISVISRIGGDENLPVEAGSSGQSVSVVTVEMHTFQPTVALNGEARPVRDIQVAAPATGVRILQLLVDEGDTVRQGQAMARLDTSLAQAQISAAQASVAEAQSAAVRARGEYERAESIRDSGALSTEAIEARRAAAEAADARLVAARAQLQEVNARLGGGYVRAPAAGLVIDRTAEVGRQVDGQVLFRIAAGNELEVAAQVAESDALALQVGQPAVFTLVDGTTEQGTLRRGPASIDSRTRTGEALFSLPPRTRVRAGMYLRGAATLPARQALGVPQSSVLYDSGQAYVFVISSARRQAQQESSGRASDESDETTSVVHRVNVQLGVREGDLVEIRSGLSANQRIVGSGAAFLQDGDQVEPLAPPSQAPSAAADSTLRGRGG